MATKKVHIDILARDKSTKVLNNIRGSLDRVKRSVFNLKTAFAGLGVGLVARDFIRTASEIENLKIRFKFLFDTVEEGEKAFKGLVKFAGEVPFQLEQIQRGAANLAVVSKDADELNEILRITGDIAAASGLDFQTTAEQIQRTFSAGINSADLFRERGVRELLGFEAGVAISAEKSKQHIIQAFRDGTLEVKGASVEMAQSFTGVVSMIQDKYLQFKIALMDAGPFDFLKASSMLLEQTVSKNFGSIEKAAKQFGDTVVEAVKAVALGSASIIDAVTPAFNFIFSGINGLFTMINNMPGYLKTFGILGFLALGTKGKLVTIAIVGVYDKIVEVFDNILSFVRKSTAKIAAAVKRLGFDETARQLESFNLILEKNSKTMVQNVSDMKQAFEDKAIDLLEFLNVDDMDPAGRKFRTMVEDILKDIDLIMTNRIKDNPVKPLTDGANEATESISKLKTAYESFKEGFGEAMKEASDIQKNFQKIGQESFAKLKETLTDFVMTGKLKFQDLARFIIRSMVEAMIGSAVSSAISKAQDMIKMSTIKKALMYVYEAGLKAFSSFPPPFNFAAMGATVAAGLGVVNKIKGFQHGGVAKAGQPAIVGENGPELIMPEKDARVIPNNQMSRMGQPVTVNFNINTVDARGFNELLVNSRGLIVNMINSAVNEKGRQAIV